MSAIRVYGKDGRPVWRPVDDGAVGRVRHSRLGLPGGITVAPRVGKPWPDLPVPSTDLDQAARSKSA